MSNYDEPVPNYGPKKYPLGAPSGGGGFKVPKVDPVGLGISALAGGVGNWLDGRQRARDQENQFNFGVARDQFLNPNRTLQDALHRNIRGNILENIGNAGSNFKFGGGDGKVGFLDIVAKSLAGGINPRLIAENKNIAGVPGLEIEGQLVGKDPKDLFEAKKPGFLESLAKGGLSLFGM